MRSSDYHAPCLLAALLILNVVSVGAELPRGGATTGDVLNLGWGATVPALGGAMPAGARGVDAAWYNPAGVAFTSRNELTASYQPMILGINQGNLGYAMPWGENSGAAVFLKYLDYGGQDRVTVTSAGAFTTLNRGGTFSAHDVVAGLAGGRYFGSGVSAGFALKVVSSQLDNASATAFAADLGAEWRPRGLTCVSFGAVVRNLGTELRFDNGRGRLPLTFELGGRATLLKERLLINASAEKSLYDNIRLRAGLELRPFGRTLSLRAGYDGTNEAGSGLTAGVGVKIEEFEVDYAYVPYGKLGDNHRVALTYRFGQARVIELPIEEPARAEVHPRQPDLHDRLRMLKDPPATASMTPPRIYVDEFAVREFTASSVNIRLEGAEELRQDLQAELSSRGLGAVTPARADGVMDCVVWLRDDGQAILDIELTETLARRSRFRTTVQASDLAVPERRAAIVAEVVAHLLPELAPLSVASR